jgi:tetratricopeptide (TPR) repeat protein
MAFGEVGKFAESDREFQRAVAIYERSTSAMTKAHAYLMVNLGALEFNRGNLDKGESLLVKGLLLTRELRGRRHPDVAAALIDLSTIRSWRDDFDGAERAIAEAVSIYRESAPELHPDRVTAEFRFGEILLLKGRTEDAALLLERTLTAQRLLFGSSSLKVADTLESLADIRLAKTIFRGRKATTRSYREHRPLAGRGSLHVWLSARPARPDPHPPKTRLRGRI